MGLLLLADQTPWISPEARVMEAVQLMTERNVGSVAAMEGSRCVGMFTERDLMRRVVACGKDPSKTRLREVMSQPVLSVSDSTSVVKAAELMRSRHIRHLAIVDERGDLQGVVALRYLLYAMLDDLEAKVGDLSAHMMADAPGG